MVTLPSSALDNVLLSGETLSSLGTAPVPPPVSAGVSSDRLNNSTAPITTTASTTTPTVAIKFADTRRGGAMRLRVLRAIPILTPTVCNHRDRQRESHPAHPASHHERRHRRTSDQRTEHPQRRTRP